MIESKYEEQLRMASDKECRFAAARRKPQALPVHAAPEAPSVLQSPIPLVRQKLTFPRSRRLPGSNEACAVKGDSPRQGIGGRAATADP
jgi:hypothetical protein